MRSPSSGAPRGRWLVATSEYAGLTPYTGGIGRHYAALLPALTQLGAEVDLLVPGLDTPGLGAADVDTAGLAAQGVRLIESDRILRGRPGAASAMVRRAFDRGRYDRVLLPEWGALGAALPPTAPLLTNLATSTRLTLEASGLGVRDMPLARRIPILGQSVREERQIRRSAGLVAISTAMLEWNRARLGNLPPAVVVPNCIDLDAVGAAARSAPLPPGWPEGTDPIVLFLGRSELRKGVTDAVAAFGLLHRRMPQVRLVLAGAGGDDRFEPTRAQLRGSIPASARDRVTWLGHVPGDDLYRGIAAAQVVLCPSRWEGFGQVALEAKAIGTPLVVTTGSGFDDFCTEGEDCAMVPPQAPPALARVTERMLADPRRAARLAAEARRRVQRYAPAPVAAQLLDAADALLGNGSDVLR